MASANETPGPNATKKHDHDCVPPKNMIPGVNAETALTIAILHVRRDFIISSSGKRR